MPDETITALVLTDPERLEILRYWPTPAAFVEWQRVTLAAEIERRAGMAAQDAVRGDVEAAVQEAQAAFPTLYEYYS